VLLRSGLRSPHIGAHLRLHPVTGLLGRFDQPFAPWRGAPMTTVCAAVEHGPNQDGYGAKIEVPSVHPGLSATALPWHNSAAYKRALAEFGRTTCLITLCRDIGQGRVAPGGPSAWDPPVVSYTMAEADVESMRAASAACIRILAAAGANKVWTTHVGPAGEHSAVIDAEHRGQVPNRSPTVAALLERVAVAPVGPVGMLGLFSAHQMGSCRMGWSAATSAVDCDGEAWEVDDLFVMDASVFPTASGANPMITTLAVSKMLSTRLAARLQAEDSAASASSSKSVAAPAAAAAAAAAAARAQRRESAARPPSMADRAMTCLTHHPAVVALAVVATVMLARKLIATSETALDSSIASR
jgi:choline dehydrogenase-like flavoprotein